LAAFGIAPGFAYHGAVYPRGFAVSSARDHEETTMTRCTVSRLLGGLVAVCLVAGASAQTATATLAPTAGNTAAGTVSFTQKGDKVTVTAKVSGLAPGAHGFHIHEKGDCSAPDATSAGGHFNPTGKPHGDPAVPDHHAGDMPMLQADASGNATLTADLEVIGIGGGATDVVGRSVVVHKDADDFKTQPAGNSGARVACGIITKS
jgi:Cu-Zn family superoxide dismutase